MNAGGGGPGMPIGKTAGAAASKKTKRRKKGAPKRKADRSAKQQKPARRLPVAPNDAKSTIRELRKQLAQAMQRVEALQASADTDFLLDIPNRRGFERELCRSIAYIKRYRA